MYFHKADTKTHDIPSGTSASKATVDGLMRELITRVKQDSRNFRVVDEDSFVDNLFPVPDQLVVRIEQKVANSGTYCPKQRKWPKISDAAAKAGVEGEKVLYHPLTDVLEEIYSAAREQGVPVDATTEAFFVAIDYQKVWNADNTDSQLGLWPFKLVEETTGVTT